METYKKMNYLHMIIVVYMFIPSIIYSNNEKNKTAVLVVTVGRSGSSCLSGVLQILGVSFGKNLLQPDSHNPKGFFENTTNSMLSSLMLKEACMFHATPQFIDWSTHPKKEWYVKIIKKHIEKEFENADIFGVKNIFLGFLLPLYTEALEDLGYKPKIIVALRDPHKVCESFQAWEEMGCNPENVYMRMAVQFSMVLKYAFSVDVMTVDYDELLQDTKKVVDRINNFIPGLRSYDDTQEELELFIDKRLNHH